MFIVLVFSAFVLLALLIAQAFEARALGSLRALARRNELAFEQALYRLAFGPKQEGRP